MNALADEMKGMLIKPVKVVRSGIFVITILSFMTFFALLTLRCFSSTISWLMCCFQVKVSLIYSQIIIIPSKRIRFSSLPSFLI